MTRVEPVYEEVRTGVVADPNMEYEEEYADYGDYEEGGENYDTSGMALDGQDGNKGEKYFMLFRGAPLN